MAWNSYSYGDQRDDRIGMHAAKSYGTPGQQSA
jgi:hypothetical protein